MAISTSIIITLFHLFPLLAFCLQKQSYIVYFSEHKGDKTFQEIEDIHHSYLLHVKNGEEDARDSLIYSYKHNINGFAASLTPDEASIFSEMEEVVSVIESYPRKYSLQTTRSGNFLGLDMAMDLDLDVASQNFDQNFAEGKELLESQLWKRTHCWIGR